MRVMDSRLEAMEHRPENERRHLMLGNAAAGYSARDVFSQVVKYLLDRKDMCSDNALIASYETSDAHALGRRERELRSSYRAAPAFVAPRHVVGVEKPRHRVASWRFGQPSDLVVVPKPRSGAPLV
jgi:hypothetical protein